MLRKANSLIGYKLDAKDDNLGEVDDFYFSTKDWTIRYMVADIGNWFTGRRVLIAQSEMGVPNWEQKLIPVDLTKEQVRDSPDIDLTRPIGREQEASLYSYYGWPTYWGAPGTLGMGMGAIGAGVAMGTPVPPATGRRVSDVPDEAEAAVYPKGERHLQSMREVTGFNIQGADGSLGSVEDFFVDDHSWNIRYLEIDTSKWLPGRQVLFSPEWVDRVDWDNSKVYTQMTKEQVKNSPEYNRDTMIDQNYESSLHKHYGYST